MFFILTLTAVKYKCICKTKQKNTQITVFFLSVLSFFYYWKMRQSFFETLEKWPEMAQQTDNEKSYKTIYVFVVFLKSNVFIWAYLKDTVNVLLLLDEALVTKKNPPLGIIDCNQWIYSIHQTVFSFF